MLQKELLRKKNTTDKSNTFLYLFIFHIYVIVYILWPLVPTSISRGSAEDSN